MYFRLHMHYDSITSVHNTKFREVKGVKIKNSNISNCATKQL